MGMVLIANVTEIQPKTVSCERRDLRTICGCGGAGVQGGGGGEKAKGRDGQDVYLGPGSMFVFSGRE